MKKILITALLLAGITVTAQVKVGNNPTTINANSILEMESTNKGMLLPRVALTGIKAAAPLSAHVEGMKVYNTATAGTAPNDVTPGEYYNDGTKWVKVSPAAPVFNPTKTVYVDVADPNSATKWSDAGRYLNYDTTTAGCIINPGFVDDALLAANTTYLYVGQSTCDENGDLTEFSYWIYDGTTYLPFQSPESTAWYLGDSSADAGANKTSMIRRTGHVLVGQASLSDRVKFMATADTGLDPLMSVKTNAALYASQINMKNTSNNPMSGVYSFSFNNTNYSTAVVGSQYGILGSTTHNGTGTVTNLRGFQNDVRANATAGIYNNGYGVISALTNLSNSTALISTMVGGQFGVNNSGASDVSNQFGLNVSNMSNTTATTGSATNMYGIYNDTRLRTTNAAAGLNSAFYGFVNSLTQSASVNTTNMRGVSQTIGITGAGIVTTNLVGISSTITSSSTGTGTTSASTGISNSTSHTSATNGINNIYGINNTITNTGKVNSGIYGVYTPVANNSTLGNNIANVFAGYNSVSLNAVNTDNYTNVYTNYNLLTNAGSGNNTGRITGDYMYVNTVPTNAGTVPLVEGRYTLVNTGGNQNIGELNGLKTSIQMGAAAVGNIGSFRGEHITLSRNATATGTITNSYGIEIASMSIPSTGSNYGIYVGAVAGAATNNFSIVSNGGVSYFKDNVGVGILPSTSTAKLHVGTLTLGVPAATGTSDNSIFSLGYGNLSWAGSLLSFGVSPTSSESYPTWLQARNPADYSQFRTIALNPLGGNVGVGTTNPKSKLHVVGLPVYADNAAAKAALGGTGVAEGAFYHTGDGIVRVVY